MGIAADRRRGIATAAAALALWLCAQAAQAAVAKVTVDSGGIKRTALVMERERLKKGRRPVYFVLHGSNGAGARIRKNLELDEVAGASGSIVVYPDAIEGHWLPAGDGDVAFIRALADKLVAEGRADPHRIFAVGASTGGMLAMRLACEQADVFAGAAAIIANMPAGLGASCKPARAIPFLLINGTADPRVPFAGGPLVKTDYPGDVLSTDATLAKFAAAAGCAGERSKTLFPNRNTKNGSRAYLEKFDGCKVPVELVRIEGGGHTIPGHWSGADSGAAAGGHNGDVDAARLVVDFFRRVSAE